MDSCPNTLCLSFWGGLVVVVVVVCPWPAGKVVGGSLKWARNSRSSRSARSPRESFFSTCCWCCNSAGGGRESKDCPEAGGLAVFVVVVVVVVVVAVSVGVVVVVEGSVVEELDLAGPQGQGIALGLSSPMGWGGGAGHSVTVTQLPTTCKETWHKPTIFSIGWGH